MMRRKLAISFMIIGVLLVAGAVTWFLYNRWDESRASEAALQTAQTLTALIEVQAQHEKSQDSHVEYPVSDIQEPESLPTIVYEGNRYVGILSIPALELSLPVMETWSYPKLKESPCRYTGDPNNNDMVIMAHNYSGHFGNISLLQYGDLVIFVDAGGREHVYEVAEIETVNSKDILGMVENEYDFTMFTCTYGGRARIAVRCISV